MAELTTNPRGNQDPGHAEDSRETGTDDARGWKKGNQKGRASPKAHGDHKIAKELVANAGNNPTLSPKRAMAERTINLKGNQEPLLANETRSDYAREAKNGKNQGSASPPKPSRNNFAKKATANKKMDDRVKKGKQSNAEGCAALRARIEKKRAQGKPPPKRGDVTKAIVREVVVAGVKMVIDTGKAFCCAPESFDVDAFLEDLPFATMSEPTATLWDKIAKERVANAGNNPTLSPKRAMAERTINLKGNQEPLLANETRSDYAREAKNGKNQGSASPPKPSRNNFAKKATANKKMDDRVKKGKQSNAEGCAALRARIEKKRAQGKPPPKRGDVTKAIVREVVVAGVKMVIDTGKAFCCAPESFDVDAFLEDLPFATMSEPTATLWDKV